MYKIYINDKPLTLTTSTAVGNNPSSELENMVTRYTGNPKSVLNYHDLLEKNNKIQSLTLYAEDVEQLFRDFCSQFKVLEAAGGVVYNEKEEALMIYRRGSWDLPKGKIEEGESKEMAALREVEEETGASSLKLGPYIRTTYHTYRSNKNKRILKVTYWYRMNTKDVELVPQHEEDIEQAVWRSIPDFMAENLRTYGNIKEILEAERKANV